MLKTTNARSRKMEGFGKALSLQSLLDCRPCWHLCAGVGGQVVGAVRRVKKVANDT